jgi:hypothetical protein
MKESSKVKVWLTCPESHADAIRLAIGDAGIGSIGNYTHCSFVTKGKGYFKPSKEANPHIGSAGGDIEAVDEVVVEFLCDKSQIDVLKEIVKKHHPYEEVAMDFFPLLEI